MQLAIHRSAAMVFTAALAGSVFAGLAPAAATTSSCVATELRLPEGTPTDVHSHLTASDPTGKCQVGFVQLEPGNNVPLLWINGEPQVLDPTPGSRSSVVDVNQQGTVLGSTVDATGQDQPWLYTNGTFQKLELPAGIQGITVRALNNRGDVVGYGATKVGNRLTPVIWPAGGTPQRLRADNPSYAADINDAGVVIGEAEAGKTTGVIWKRWDAKGVPVTGANGAQVSLTHIQGNWFVGLQIADDGSITGGRWSTRSTKVVSFPNILDAVNGSGDVASSDDSGQTFVTRPDGTKYAIDAPGYNTVGYLFERGQKYDAAGDRDYGFGRAVLWSGCAG